jgi:anti-anti-sigma factor
VERDLNLLHHRVVVDGPVVRIVVGGEVDLSNADELQRVLGDQVVAADAGERVEVDLSAVEFCAAVGARVLVEATRRARTRGVQLRLEPRSAAINLVLDICGWQDEVEPGDPGPVGVVRWLRRVTPPLT